MICLLFVFICGLFKNDILELMEFVRSFMIKIFNNIFKKRNV